MEPYRYEDDGCVVTVEQADEVNDGCAKLRIDDAGESLSCDLPPEQASLLTVALFETAGFTAPVIIGRIPVDPDKSSQIGPLHILIDSGNSLQVGLDVDGGQAWQAIPPALLKQFARVAVSYAEAAEDEPAPADVDELALTIRLALYPDSERIGLQPSGADRTAARVALRWVKQRERKA